MLVLGLVLLLLKYVLLLLLVMLVRALTPCLAPVVITIHHHHVIWGRACVHRAARAAVDAWCTAATAVTAVVVTAVIIAIHGQCMSTWVTPTARKCRQH